MAFRLRPAIVAVALLATVFAATVSGRASAQTPAPSRARAPADLARAKSAFDEGVRQYNVGDYATAVESFRTAYLSSGRADILFNIAQAYRLAGDCARAELSYRSYLREKPDAPDRAGVERRIEEMSACAPKATEPAPVEHDTSAPSAPPPPPPPPSAVDASRAEHEQLRTERSGPRALRIVSIGTGVVAAGLVASGIYFSLSGASDERALRHGGWDPEVNESGERANTLAVISYVGAGMMAVAALALWIVAGRTSTQKTSTVSLDSGRLVF